MPKLCVVCDTPFLGRVVPIRSYCDTCRPFVQEVIGRAHKVMHAANIPAAAGYECVDCKRPAFSWDHRYYSQPLEVEPVCARCNTNRGPAHDVRQLARELMGIFSVPEPPEQSQVVLPPKDLQAHLDAIERAWIKQAVAQAKNNRTAAAKALGVTYRSLRYRIDRLRID
jgi:Bacterial regulatory protein, Fis family